MPHQCTGCGRRFADGSKRMLSGCPDCGGSTFRYLPDGDEPAGEAPPESREPPEPPDPPEPPGPDGGTGLVGRVGRVTAKVREAVGDGRDAAIVDGEAAEDGAQSSARSEVVAPEELPDGPRGVGAAPFAGADRDPDGRAGGPASTTPGGRVVETPSGRTPGLAELRAELNDQFEGIRILEPGQYELNLMELYEREETIIALRENGRYVIDPPEAWLGDGD